MKPYRIFQLFNRLLDGLPKAAYIHVQALRHVVRRFMHLFNGDAQHRHLAGNSASDIADDN
jgi:hypothetical protein